MSAFEITPQMMRVWKGERLGHLANKIAEAPNRATAMRLQRSYRKTANALLASAWAARGTDEAADSYGPGA